MNWNIIKDIEELQKKLRDIKSDIMYLAEIEQKILDNMINKNTREGENAESSISDYNSANSMLDMVIMNLENAKQQEPEGG